jgi:hypothetical protein
MYNAANNLTITIVRRRYCKKPFLMIKLYCKIDANVLEWGDMKLLWIGSGS